MPLIKEEEEEEISVTALRARGTTVTSHPLAVTGDCQLRHSIRRDASWCYTVRQQWY